MPKRDNYYIEKINIEEDMKTSAIKESDGFTKRVFKKCPLIGDYVISGKNLETLYSNVKKYIDMRMSSENAKVGKNAFNANVHEQTALAVVNYAKEWNSNEEGKFTRYIAMQFGYKDDYWRVWGIITESIEIALNGNKKFFIRRNDDRQFYETVMSHSFGPKGSWLPLVDLLFSFYKDNLDWKYVPGDPLFVRLVRALQSHFNYDADGEDDFLIASKSYSLKVGIRRLVQERPGYCVKLFEGIVHRIDELLQNKAEPSKRYVYTIVDLWYKDLLSNVNEESAAASVREYRHRNVDIALNYSEVSIKYSLIDDEVYVNIPSIRLLGEETGDAKAYIYINDEISDELDLSVSGNELGETICGSCFKLPTEKLLSADIRLRVVIVRGDDRIYDSAKKLWRSVILFSYGNEVNLNRIDYEDYQLFAVKKQMISGENIEFYDNDTKHIIDAFFDEGYKLRYSGKTLALDSSSIKDISILEPQTIDGAFLEVDGEEYKVISEKPELFVYLSDEDEIKKYRISINGEVIEGTDYWDADNNRLEICPHFDSGERIKFTIADLAKGKTVFDNEYYYLEQFRYSFNQDYFMTANELEHGEIKISFVGNDDIKGKLNGNSVYKTGLEPGLLVIDVPFANCEVRNIERVYFDKYIREVDIKKNTLLHVENKGGRQIGISIGDYYTESVKEDLNIYDVIHSFHHLTEGFVDIVIDVDSKRSVVYQIVYGNAFLDNPIIGVKDNVFWWDGGLTYIGDMDANLTISIENNNGHYSFPLGLGERAINVFTDKEFDDGDYEWSILQDEDVICKGRSFLGDERKVRFKDKIIRIDRIAGDIDDKTSEVRIKDVYIDQIKFVETAYVKTEEDVFDVYTGCMYWNGYDGKRYYSFKYTDKKYKVNPVKIIYISNKYLRIVNVDDEGIYCFYNRFSANPGREITDYEPTKNIKDYNDILFYLYTVESDGKKVSFEHVAEKSIKVEQKKDNSDKVVHQVAPVVAKKTVEQKLFENLREQTQEAVIMADVGERILVNAGPGTGKTWTLIEKIIYMVKELEVDPETIQVLCFSRAAVEVIKNRIEQETQEDIDNLDIRRIDVRTFDSFATQLLYWVRDSEYGVIPDNYQIEALNYEERIQKFTEVIEKEPDLISECHHLVVDEVQDLVLSRADMVLTMIRNLPPECGVTLLGDACQAIYDYQLGKECTSLEFYREIKRMNTFVFYSFSENHRQTSELISYSDGYRKYILNEDVTGCVDYLESLLDIIPSCKVKDLGQFNKAALDFYFKDENVAILTRNNAQALTLSGALRENGVKHSAQRRLNDMSLCAWIAIVINDNGKTSYNRSEFLKALSEVEADGIEEIWDFLSDGDSDRRLDTKDILKRIKETGSCRYLYSAGKTSKLTVSTIHRSKGREYDSVIILDELLDDGTEDLEEHRVKYVAVSRAKSHVYVSSMKKVYFRTLENRRCFSAGKSFKTNNRYLRNFEVGLKDDLNVDYFVTADALQEWIRENADVLIGKKVYLSRQEHMVDGCVVYDVVLEEDNTIIGQTSRAFSWDLSQAIRQIKGLSNRVEIYDYLYPTEFYGIYITDISTEIAMMRGFEEGVVDFGGMTAWNKVQIEGYAKASY